MRLMSGFRILAAVLLASAGLASADTIQLGSYGSTGAVPGAFGNGATFYQPATAGGSNATYNVPGGGGRTWAAALGSSNWISFDANAYPGGSSTPANGTYIYQTTFTLAPSPYLSGSVSVLADDAATVFLNGYALSAVNGASPSLQTIATYLLPATYLRSGTNTLTFNVQQVHGGATGLDYSGTITTTPEPASLVLLGTGVVVATIARQRRERGQQRAQAAAGVDLERDRSAPQCAELLSGWRTGTVQV